MEVLRKKKRESATTPRTMQSSESLSDSPPSLRSERSYQPFAQDAMTANASIPTCNASVSTDGSNPKEINTNVSVSTEVSGITLPPRTSMKHEMARIRELEGKRLALRNQRFSLEQRLYEFCGSTTRHDDDEGDDGDHHNDPAGMDAGTEKYVVDMDWTDSASGISYVYSGPINLLNEPHGRDGIIRFADGQVYAGSVRSGVRHGQGINKWSDGQSYSGEWKANSRNGRGTHSWPDGRKATGHWSEGHLNGKVYFMWPNGATFDGTCKMGKKNGRGIHTYSDGRVYSGTFEDGKETGFATLSCPDGTKYRGQFKNGKKCGYGIQLWKTRTYDGEWEDDKPHGQGRVVWSNGATYTGRFAMGKYHGLGVYMWASGKKFVGRWQNGVKNGHGLYTWPSGKKYDGEYKGGVKHGYGRMQFADGQIYCGAWLKNMRHGRGVQTAADGTIIYCGQWGNDVPLEEESKAQPSAKELQSIAEIRGGIPSHVEMRPWTEQQKIDMEEMTLSSYQISKASALMETSQEKLAAVKAASSSEISRAFAASKLRTAARLAV